MAQLSDRIAYRLAGFVWTALYAGLSKRTPVGSFVDARSADEQPVMLAEQAAAIAA
jgi:hypothetical protein